MTQSNVFHMSNIRIHISLPPPSLISMITISKHGRKGSDQYKSWGARWGPATKPTDFTVALWITLTGDFLTALTLSSDSLEQEVSIVMWGARSTLTHVCLWGFGRVERLATDCYSSSNKLLSDIRFASIFSVVYIYIDIFRHSFRAFRAHCNAYIV